MQRVILFFAAVFATVCAAVSSNAIAQDFPNRPIKLIAGFAPGGNVDVVARIVAQYMSEGLGRQVVVENRTGAGSMIANDAVAKSAPDGYTLLTFSGAFLSLAATKKSLPYDPARDFTFISSVVSYPLVFAVRQESPYASLGDVIGIARNNPGKLNYPSPGVGSMYHLAAELFNSMAGTEMTHVPFRGGSEPATEVMAGRMDMLVDALTAVYPLIRAGKLRPLAVSSPAPSPSLPGVPTVSRFVAGYEADSFLGIVGPAGLPPEVTERLNREVRRVVDLPEVGKRFAEWGGTPRASTPEEMRVRVEREIAQWKRVVATRKIEIN